MTARFPLLGAAAPLLFLSACATPVAEAPPEHPAPPPELIRQTRPPLHTAAFLEAIDGAQRFEPADLAAFERSVVQDPNDWAARAKILAYATRTDQNPLPGNLALRKAHVFWLIEHDPSSEVLASYLARFQPGELSTEEWSQAAALWESAAQAHPHSGRVLSSAAHFFMDADPARRRRYLELAAGAEPENAWHGAALGEIYTAVVIRSIRETTPETLRLAMEAQHILQATNNAAIVEAAAYILHSELNHPMRPASPGRISALAQQMTERARLLNPDADESWINPAPPPAMEDYQAPTEKQIAAARACVVRLAPSDFPELPPAIARWLADRGCGIPQISHSQTKDNLVRGEFFAAGKPGWAVICSKDGWSQILVFRNDEDLDPYVLVESEDFVCLAEERNCGSYQTAIRAVDREFILYHYRAYGGAEPPPIDHHGIDIAVVEKASVVRYFHNGQWLTLTGSD